MGTRHWPTPAELVALAFDSADRREFRSQVLQRLSRCVGVDFAIFANLASPPEPWEVLHLDLKVAEQARHTYLERSPLMTRAFRILQERGAVVDTEAYASREWERLPYVERHQRQYGVKSNLVVSWASRGGDTVVISLARAGRRFDADDQRSAQRIRKAFAVADAAFGNLGPESAPNLPSELTERQREILGYVCRGYSNAEIACACGISAFTVRNHLVKLFERYQVATRTELALLMTRRA